MRRLMLAGTSLLIASVWSATAAAASITFGFTGSPQTYTALATILHDILALGRRVEAASC